MQEADGPRQVPFKLPSSSTGSRASCDSSHCYFCHGPANPASSNGTPSDGLTLVDLPRQQRIGGRRKRSWNDSQSGDASVPIEAAGVPREAALRRDRVSSTALDSLTELPATIQHDHAVHRLPSSNRSPASSVPFIDEGYSSGSASSHELADSVFDTRQVSGRRFPRNRQPNSLQLTEVAAFQTPSKSLLRCNADIICGVDFTGDGSLIVAAGMAKQVRVYSLRGISYGTDSLQQKPILVHRMPSKMSSVVWDPDCEGVVTVGDYDGVVSQIHLASGHIVADVDEHAGRRVWSVAHSKLRSTFCVSTADDGTARLWAGAGLAASAGVVCPPGGQPICGADFSEFNENLLALASSDHTAYVYDLRRLTHPLLSMKGHERPVSFVRFLDDSQLLTAAIDSSLAAWQLPGTGRRAGLGMASAGEGQLVSELLRRYSGHLNRKNFVGLALNRDDGLIACGSEDARVYVYQPNSSRPIAWRDTGAGSTWQQPPRTAAGTKPGILLLATDMAVAEQPAPYAGGFVSAVAWRPSVGVMELGSVPVLAAASSDGNLQLLSMME